MIQEADEDELEEEESNEEVKKIYFTGLFLLRVCFSIVIFFIKIITHVPVLSNF